MALPAVGVAFKALFAGAKTGLSAGGALAKRGGSAVVSSFRHTNGGAFARAKTALGAGAKGVTRGYAQMAPATQTALRNTGLAAGGLAAGHALLSNRG